MRFVDIEVGAEYALRLKVSEAEPLLRVIVLSKVPRNHQVKVRHLGEPNAGMEEFFGIRHFLCSWKERRRFLTDEARLRVVRERSAGVDFTLKDAVSFVLGCTAEPGFWLHSDGHLSARAFAAAEPDTVTMEVAAIEERYSALGYAPGERDWHQDLQKQRPVLALARQWAGVESELARLNQEIARLRSIAQLAVSYLREGGLITQANRISRAVDGR